MTVDPAVYPAPGLDREQWRLRLEWEIYSRIVVEEARSDNPGSVEECLEDAQIAVRIWAGQFDDCERLK
jgi:hypothetical protein